MSSLQTESGFRSRAACSRAERRSEGGKRGGHAGLHAPREIMKKEVVTSRVQWRVAVAVAHRVCEP